MPPRLALPSARCPYAGLQRVARFDTKRFIASAPEGRIPPESPKFIEVPRSLQPHAYSKRPVKGILPVPRQIFPRGSKDKTSPEYLAFTTQEPKERKNAAAADSPTAGLVEWKARQAGLRRRNLRESLVELQYRKERTDRQVAARSSYKEADHMRRSRAPEREDERLTSASVPEAMKVIHFGTPPDPDREARTAEKKARVAAKEAERREERRSNLHDLYINAGLFITSEKDLRLVVNTLFDDKEQFMSSVSVGENIWHHGYPDTVADMLNRVNKEGKVKAVEANRRLETITAERVRRIAEELTGGRM